MEIGGVPPADVLRGRDRRAGLHREERLFEAGGNQPGDLAVATHCSPPGRQRAKQQQRQHECRRQRRRQKLFARAPHPARVHVRTEASGRPAIHRRIIRMPSKRLRGRGMRPSSENRGFRA